MINPTERRRPKGRFGVLWRFEGFRGVGTRDWAARVSLMRERGCASEPVAREGGMWAGPEGGGGRRRGPEGPKSREIGPRFFVTGESAGKFHQLFRVLDFLSILGHDFENYFGGSFLVLVPIVHQPSSSASHPLAAA